MTKQRNVFRSDEGRLKNEREAIEKLAHTRKREGGMRKQNERISGTRECGVVVLS